MKILVRGTNWVGDAVMSIPALEMLRAAYPTARIVLQTRSWAEGIFRDADFIDEILTFDKSKSKVSDAMSQARELRKAGFDLAIVFPNSFETALVVKLAGIPRRIGYAKEGRSFLLTDAVPMPEWKNARHESHYYLNLIQTLTATEPAPDFTNLLAVSETRRAAARTFLAERVANPERPTIALGAGSTNSRAKRWSAASFAALADLIEEELGANVILVGARDEIDVAREVAAAAKRAKPVILSGETTLAEATALMAVVDALVANDMGLAHVAAATGTPTLVVFGPTNELTTRPLGSEIIRVDVDCAPCMLRDCPIDHRCMTGVAPDAVFRKLTTLLAS